MKQLYSIIGFFFFLSLPFIPKANPTNNVIEFVENKGQWAHPFLYKAVTTGGAVYLEKNGFTYMVGANDNAEKVHSVKHGKMAGPQTLHYHAYQVLFDGALTPKSVVGGKAQKHYYNYFLGSDPTKWKSEIHPFMNVDYTDIYANIDVHVASEYAQLKYDFIVKPNGDPSQIRLRIKGADAINIKNNKLQIHTSVGTVEEMQPYAYQSVDGVRKEVKCRYKLDGDVVYFDLPNGYDTHETLVIDPTVVFASFTGSTSDNWGLSATYDGQGNFYAGGSVSGTTYPVTPGAFQQVFAGGGNGGGNNGAHQCDMAITKFNSLGTMIIYSTYIGGADNDQPHSMIVDPFGDLLIAGRTFSNNFPVTPNCYDNSYNGNADLVVVKLNPAGSGLVGSTYMGGSDDDAVNISSVYGTVGSLKISYADDARSEIITDKLGNAYVAAPTRSTNFPVTPGAFQTVHNGAQDGVIFKLNPNLTTLTWSTFVGGSGDDAAYVLALDTGQTNLYVAGGTASSNFPVTPGTLWPAYQGGVSDGYILKFQNGGTYPRLAGTFIGRGAYDQCYGLQIDNENRVYAMGHTLGGNFPVSAGVYSNPSSSQFIIKLDANLNNNIYSTVFGNGNPNLINISPVAFLVDTCQNVYISGWGGTLLLSGGDLLNMPVTPNAMQPTTNGNGFYFFVVSKNAQALLYGSYLSAPAGNQEHVDGGTSRFDKNGIIYQGICGGCGGQSNFPTTPGTVSPTNGSTNCNFLAVKIAFNFVLSAQAIIGPDTIGCAPLTVTFTNNSTYATSYEWDFGDNTSSTLQNPPPHTYNTPGTYQIRLIAINPTGCNKSRDTTYKTIIVKTGGITAGFNVNITDSCGPFKASFTNTSVYSPTPGSTTFTTFIWKFGDGSPNYTGTTPPPHTFPASGTYTVTLIMRDSTSCNNPDSIKHTFTFSGNLVKAGFRGPDSLCLGTPVTYTDTSKNATGFAWTFGEGGTATTSSPSYVYPAVGTYTIWQVVTNPASCNKRDSIKRTITIMPLAIADFDYSPHIPVTNMPIQFSNLSTNATSYIWNFGDNTGSTEKNPSHLYKRTGKFRVCLVAKTSSGCPDTVCKDVDADVRTLADVPTGFSPNGDGHNDVLYVRGGAIEKMNFKVFNRWGELVFETSDLAVGWDGTYKGKPQQMDAYAFILNVTFIDGNTFYKKGNVTLVR